MVFLFQPFKGKWVQTLGCFLSKGSASGTVLQKLIIECIGLAEKSGLRIDAVVTDGASWNRNMWKTFGITKENISAEHVVDPKRRLWFISDFPHLIKCLRNFLTHQDRDVNSGIWVQKLQYLYVSIYQIVIPAYLIHYIIYIFILYFFCRYLMGLFL